MSILLGLRKRKTRNRPAASAVQPIEEHKISPASKPPRYIEGGPALFTRNPTQTVTSWGLEFKGKLEAKQSKGSAEIEEAWDQRRREAQRILANTSMNNPEVPAGPGEWNNKSENNARDSHNDHRDQEPNKTDHMTEGEQKDFQQLLDSRGIEADQMTQWDQKCFEQLINSKRFCPQKQGRKEVRIHKKWARGTTGSSTSVVHPTTPNTATPGPPSGSGIFMFGSYQKQVNNKNDLEGTPPIRRMVINKMKNHHPSKDNNGIGSPKKKKTSKKSKRHKEHLMWMSEQKNPKTIRARKSKGTRQTRERPQNKYVLCENKKPAIQVGRKRRRAWYIAPKKGKKKRKEVRYREDETTTLRNIKWWKIPLAGRQAPSPAARYARLKSNKRYKPGD